MNTGKSRKHRNNRVGIFIQPTTKSCVKTYLNIYRFPVFTHVCYLILRSHFLWGYNMWYVVVCVYESMYGVVWFKEKKEIGKFCTQLYHIRANITIVLCILTSIRLYYKDSKTHLKPFYHSTKPIYNNTILFSLRMYKRYIPFCPLQGEMK